MQQVFHPMGTPLAPMATIVNLASVSTSSFQHSLPLSCKSEAVTPVSVAKFEALMSEEGERGKQETGTNLQGGSLDSKRLTVKTDSDVKPDDQPKEVAVKFEPHKSSVLSMKVQRKVYPCTQATWERRKIALLPATRPHKIMCHGVKIRQAVVLACVRGGRTQRHVVVTFSAL